MLPPQSALVESTVKLPTSAALAANSSGDSPAWWLLSVMGSPASASRRPAFASPPSMRELSAAGSSASGSRIVCVEPGLERDAADDLEQPLEARHVPHTGSGPPAAASASDVATARYADGGGGPPPPGSSTPLTCASSASVRESFHA